MNYGTDISTEGRMIIKNILDSTWRGLGDGETPIFPIQIYKLKKGVTFGDGAPNDDLFKLSCRVSAKRLYPNFVNLDAPYNAELYISGHPETEMATMGCVEGSEIIEYKIDNKLYIKTFKDAYKHIETLAEANAYGKNSEYIDVEALNISVKDHGNKFSKVKKIIRNKNVDNWRVVKFDNGISLTATSDHPLPVIGKGRTHVKDMVIGDRIEIDNSNLVESTTEFESKYFGKNTYILGLILADGSYSSSQICISLDLDEEDIVTSLDEQVEHIGYRLNIKKLERGQKGSYYDCCIRKIGQLKEAREELADIFGGYSKKDRRISSELLTSSREQRLELLAGLVDADGSLTNSVSEDEITERSYRFSLGSTNKALAMTEFALILGLGYKAKMYRNKYSSAHNKKRFLIEFEITEELLNKLKCSKKKDVDMNKICVFSNVDSISVQEIIDGCEENEEKEFSYDLETVTDTLNISFIHSHNCRTRVGKNVYDPDKSVIPGRGNLSFTSINLPRLGILANGNIDKFYEMLDEKLELVHKQLQDRFEIQCKKHPINYPFLMGQGNWLGSENLGPTDDIRSILKHGTLTVGFIGLAETLVALTGKHHGESEASQKLGLEIVQHMRDYTDAWSKEEHMNYSVIGTPAEGLSGRFIRMDKKRFGTIPGVTDRDYYTNSSHVPVYYPISAYKKIEIESPYHEIENGGHILYIELDGDPTKNLRAFEKLVIYMHDKNAGYFAINHPVDRDSVCGYVGIIGDVCPRCGRREGEPMTMEMWNKLHGYMNVGNADTLGYHGDPAEEADRMPNSIYGSKIKYTKKDE